MLAVALTAGLLSGAVAAEKKPERVPVPTVNIERGDKCVEDTDYMRRNHGDLILHQRNKTTREGIRTKKYSLKNCVDCHASKETNSVVGKEGFCENCHAYTAVKIDCFSCHTAERTEETKVGAPAPRRDRTADMIKRSVDAVLPKAGDGR
ncbi:MAG: hypothetical protein BMS9Abin22_033 [Gammaproteobacteria bacterium]|nr:MAG: hypothetical protein BMS9Abin22_033 [Gammaproteobacteria bacterium]